MSGYTKIQSDPPWKYNQRSVWSVDDPARPTRFGGGATGGENSYPTIPDQAMLDVWAPWTQSHAAKDAVMFLWSVWPKLDFCIEYGKACGFQYVTCGFIWLKYTKSGIPMGGPGHYTSSNSEPVLLFRRGKIPPPYIRMQNQIVETWEEMEELDPIEIKTPRLRKHSEKPLEVKRRIDAMYPSWAFGHGLGLFERAIQPGWDIFGNEVDSIMVGPDGEKPKPLNGSIVEQQRFFL